jgi:hypothetical protein
MAGYLQEPADRMQQRARIQFASSATAPWMYFTIQQAADSGWMTIQENITA